MSKQSRQPGRSSPHYTREIQHKPEQHDSMSISENPGRAARAVLAAREAVPGGPDLVGPSTALPQRSKRTEHRRDKLLDVSELLFARWGYTGVSVRDVTDLADMRLASVTYYFGSKQNLYLEVLRRRAKPLSEARMAAMEVAIATDRVGVDFVRELVRAYMMPALDFSVNGGEGWRNFFQLIGHVTFSRIWPPEINRYFNGPAQIFIRALRERFVHVTDVQAQAASLLIIGPVIYILARTGRVETFDNPAFTSDSLDTLAPITLDFVTGGVCQALGIDS